MNKYHKIALVLSGVTLTGAFAMYAYANYKELDNIDFEIKPPKAMPKLNGKKLVVNIPVELKNPTDIAVTVFDAKLHLTIDDVDLGYINLNDAVKIKKNGMTNVVVAYTFNVDITDILNKSLKFSKAVAKIMARQKVKIAVNGTATAGLNKIIKKEIPLKDFYSEYNVLGDVVEKTTIISEYDELSEQNKKENN